jgi:HTH-type transcriptional regulator/antitoxin HigA
MLTIQCVTTVKPIRSDQDLEKAHQRLDELIVLNAAHSEDADLRDEFEVLTALIYYYESRTPDRVDWSGVDAVDLILSRMEDREWKGKDLARVLDISESRVSEVLSRKRPISFEMAKKLHQKLRIPAEVLLNT